MAWLHIVGAKATCRVSKHAADSGKSPEGPEENFLLIMETYAKSEVFCSSPRDQTVRLLQENGFHP